MTKKERLSIISNIISKQEISTQEELTVALNNLGYSVSQATISRDINELALLKVKGENKRFKYALVEKQPNVINPQILNIFKQTIISIERANNLIVLKTLSGNASSAGLTIDQMKFPQVLGTVAGDDTLLIIVKSNLDAEYILKCLRSI